MAATRRRGHFHDYDEVCARPFCETCRRFGVYPMRLWRWLRAVA